MLKRRVLFLIYFSTLTALLVWVGNGAGRQECRVISGLSWGRQTLYYRNTAFPVPRRLRATRWGEANLQSFRLLPRTSTRWEALKRRMPPRARAEFFIRLAPLPVDTEERPLVDTVRVGGPVRTSLTVLRPGE